MTNQAVSTSMPAIENACFLLSLKLGTLPNSKKVPSASIEVRKDMPFDPDTDTEMLRVSKKLFDCPELDELKQFHHSLRDFIEQHELPTKGQFRGGMYLMSITHLPAVEERLKDSVEQVEDLVDRLIEVLPLRISEAEGKLGTLFNEFDYPTESKIRERLRVVYEYQTLATPEGLKRYSADMYKREEAKLKARMEEAAMDCREIIAARAKDLLAAITDRLTPSLDGKPKVMRKDMIESWSSALDLMSEQNITGDADLAAVIAAAKEKLAGRETLSMKGDAALRTEIATTFKGLIERLDEQVIDKPLRAITFEEAA